MTIGSTPVTIANRALAEIAAQSTITSLDDPSTEAVTCKIFYEPLRAMLMRAANWNFGKRQASMSLLGSRTTGDSIGRWPFKYAYPVNCARLRFLNDQWGCGPLQSSRFDIQNEDFGIETRTVVLSNVPGATAVYTSEVRDPTLFDSMFEEAFVMALASKLVLPLSGNVGLKSSFIAAATDAVIAARASDGNEGQHTTDHTPDWISARNLGVYGWGAESPFGGMWYQGWGGLSL